LIDLPEPTVESAVALLAGATLLARYVRDFVRVRRWRRTQALRRERAARQVVTLDYVDEPALDGLADHLLISDAPHRLRRIELERLTSDERAGSISAAPRVKARVSSRRRRDLRERYQGRPEPSLRLDAILDDLEGPRALGQGIVASNDQLISGVHAAMREHDREFHERFSGREYVPPYRSRDGDAVQRAVAVTAEQALEDCLLIWSRGRFAVHRDGDQLILEGTLAADRDWLHGLLFPVRAHVSPEDLTSYGARLRPGTTVPLEVLGTATHFSGEPPHLDLAPIAIFSRSSLHLPKALAHLPVLLDALPRPVRALTIRPWLALTSRDPDRPDLGPERAARRALRGRGTPDRWLDG